MTTRNFLNYTDSCSPTHLCRIAELAIKALTIERFFKNTRKPLVHVHLFVTRLKRIDNQNLILCIIPNFSTIFCVSLYYLHQFISYSVLIWLSNVKVTRSSINFHFTPEDGLWFRPKYRITSNITLFIQPLPLLQLLSGSNRNKLATFINVLLCESLWIYCESLLDLRQIVVKQ